MLMFHYQINSNIGYVLESNFVLLLDCARITFQVLLWPIVIIGLIGNAAVLCRIILAPSGRFSMLKPFYRCALLSFATSDLLLLFSSGNNTLMAISYRTTVLWKLPNWTCSAIPYIQTVAVFSGSLTLAGIAIDRALTSKYPSSKGYPWPYAVLFNALVWSIALAASYPILGMYKVDYIFVIKKDLTIYEGRICSTDQELAAIMYTTLFLTIFAPLAVIFIAVHVLLALNIWRRQDQSNKSHLPSGNDSQSTELSTVSNPVRRPKQPPTRTLTANHIRRKKRTINVILVLILAFLLGRLPIWIFLLFKLHTQLQGIVWHHLQIIFSGVTFINAALDPFLYAFLCESLSLLAFLQTCRRKKQVEITPCEEKRKAALSCNPTIVPRGPYNF